MSFFFVKRAAAWGWVAVHGASCTLGQPSPPTRSSLSSPLWQVQDIPRLLQRLSSCQLKPDLTCFKQMHASLTHLLTLRDIVQQMADGSAVSRQAWVYRLGNRRERGRSGPRLSLPR